MERGESVTQVTFTAVKQSTNGHGAEPCDGGHGSMGEGKGVRDVMDTGG